MTLHKLHQKICRAAATALDLPETIVPNVCELYICGKESVWIGAYERISRAEETCVAFSCDGFAIQIHGEALHIDAASGQSAIVRGRLFRICFE